MGIVTPLFHNVNTLWYGVDMDAKESRLSWLNAGLQALEKQGPDGLRAMQIAKQLGVTKGSFYWHFKDLAEFRAAVLNEWERCHTRQAIACVEAYGGSEATKLRNIFLGSAGDNFMLSRAVRAWSLTDAQARKAQTRVDDSRIEYLEQRLRGVGWADADAVVLARWSYCAFIGYSTVDGPTVNVPQLELVLGILTPKSLDTLTPPAPQNSSSSSPSCPA
jgi:AcrR family transcriptional regulator